MNRILDRAGVTAWPRLFHNLRASCQTDWQARFPLADVCRWIGNSPDVAARHYLTARDENFAAATRSSEPATQARPSNPTGPNPTPRSGPENADLVAAGVPCNAVGEEKVGAGGFEPP